MNDVLWQLNAVDDYWMICKCSTFLWTDITSVSLDRYRSNDIFFDADMDGTCTKACIDFKEMRCCFDADFASLSSA